MVAKVACIEIGPNQRLETGTAVLVVMVVQRWGNGGDHHYACVQRNEQLPTIIVEKT